MVTFGYKKDDFKLSVTFFFLYILFFRYGFIQLMHKCI